MAAGKRIEMELPCTLSEAELAFKSQMLAETVATKDEVGEAKRAAAKEFNDRLVGLEERQRELSAMVRTGVEERLVACEVLYHTPAEASKRTVRLDTGEVVKEEAMTAAECQLHLFASYVAFENFMNEQTSEAPEKKPDPPLEYNDPG